MGLSSSVRHLETGAGISFPESGDWPSLSPVPKGGQTGINGLPDTFFRTPHRQRDPYRHVHTPRSMCHARHVYCTSEEGQTKPGGERGGWCSCAALSQFLPTKKRAKARQRRMEPTAGEQVLSDPHLQARARHGWAQKVGRGGWVGGWKGVATGSARRPVRRTPKLCCAGHLTDSLRVVPPRTLLPTP